MGPFVRSRGFAPCLVVALLPLAGCSRAHTVDDDAGRTRVDASGASDAAHVEDAAPPLSIEAFIAAYREARCVHDARCEGFFFTRASDVAQWCHPAAREPSYSWPVVPRLDGTCEPAPYDFDAATAQRCLDALAADDCHVDYADAELDACFGAISWGDRCLSGRCREGEVCPPAESGSTACMPRLGEGSPCTGGDSVWPSDCQLDLRCRDGVCTRLPSDGEACGRECAPGFRCEDGRCASDGQPNGPCVFSCLGDYHCVRATDGVERCTTGGAPGESCTEPCPPDAPCDPPPCARGSRCVDGTCRVIALPGEPCGATAVCLLSFHCEEGVCTPDPSVGEPCALERPCVLGRCTDGTCVGRQPDESCEWLDGAPLGDCASGGVFDCPYDTNRCVARGALGEPCGPSLGDRCDVGLDCDWDTYTCVDPCSCVAFCPP